jgi:outer membrane protein assembly factor BamB
VPPGCDLFGDERYLFAVPRGSQQALVFSTIDGRPVGEATVPKWNEQLATIGRQVIRWHKQNSELSAVDPQSGAVLWKYEFEKQARVDIAEGRYVGVVEPGGRCAIVDAASGDLLVDYKSAARLKVNQVFLLAGSDNFVLVAQQPAHPARDRQVAWLNQWDYEVIDGQVFVFDRRTGRSAWSRSADVRQESFILSQPVDLPVVAFAGRITRRNAGGGRQAISLLLLEKTSGRLLFHDDTLPQTNANYCDLKVVDEHSHEMAVEMTSRTVQLKFTDRHRPPEPPAVVGGESVGKSGSSGLYEITRKLLGGD